MSETKKFREMTDDEIESAFRRLANSCQCCNEPAAVFKERVKKDFDCPYTVAISYSKTNGAGQRMHMGMVNSPNSGKTISF